MSRLWIVFSLLLGAQTAQVVRLYPVDDTGRDSGFHSYVNKLRSAVTAHNANALHKLVDPEVVTGPADGDTGWAKFSAKWRPEDANSSCWTALSDLLELGFVREQPGLFLSPYLVWRFPRELNRRTHLVVIRDKAPLRGEPSMRAPVAAYLSFDVVLRMGPTESGEGAVQWVRVSTQGGQSGYLNARDVMSPMMPRAQFGIRRGRWMLIALEGQE